MDNGLTFRFEAANIKALLDKLDPTKKDHILVTLYLEPVPGSSTALLRAKAESYTQEASGAPSIPTGDTKGGCPVPPCA
ncbi:MAG: hypothetical protein JO072_10035 [Parafilimonas sp.]|nr:hypothetical protein [Parafilimonas sp.]